MCSIRVLTKFSGDPYYEPLACFMMCVCVRVCMHVCNIIIKILKINEYKEFCVGGLKQKQCLFLYRTAKCPTVLYWIVTALEIDKQFYIEYAVTLTVL